MKHIIPDRLIDGVLTYPLSNIKEYDLKHVGTYKIRQDLENYIKENNISIDLSIPLDQELIRLIDNISNELDDKVHELKIMVEDRVLTSTMSHNLYTKLSRDHHTQLREIIQEKYPLQIDMSLEDFTLMVLAL